MSSTRRRRKPTAPAPAPAKETYICISKDCGGTGSYCIRQYAEPPSGCPYQDCVPGHRPTATWYRLVPL